MNITRKNTQVKAFVWDGDEKKALDCFSDVFELNFNSGNMMLIRSTGSLVVEPGNYVIIDEIDNIYTITPAQANDLFEIDKNAHVESKNTEKQAKTGSTRDENAHVESGLDIITQKAKENANG